MRKPSKSLERKTGTPGALSTGMNTTTSTTTKSAEDIGYWVGRFATTYVAMAALGQCDEPPGAEYSRVLREWNEAGMPENIADFIRRRANVGPEA